MGKLSSAAASADHKLGLLTQFDRALQLAPEALLLTALLCLYTVWPSTPIALLAGLLVVVFFVRVAALHLARAALERGSMAQAGALLRIARLLNPGSPDALALEGALALSNGASSLAVVRLRRAIALQPYQAAYHAALSGALLELNRPNEAIQAAQKAIELDPRCAVAYLHLAQAEQLCGVDGRIIEERLRTALASQPTPATEAVVRCVLAGLLLSEQRTAEATLTIHGAEALLPQCPATAQAMLRIHLSELLALQGQMERAQEYLQSVADFDKQGRYTTVTWRAAQH